jgi:hypothetical protein
MSNTAKESKKYSYPKQVILQAALEAIKNLDWGLLQNINNVIIAQVPQKWGGFGEKVTITISEEGEVTVFSVNDKKGGLGFWWGHNNNNILGFYQEFDGCIGYFDQKYSYQHRVSENSSKTVTDIPEQIEKLSLLKDKGVISSEEFEKKKKELLNRL